MSPETSAPIPNRSFATPIISLITALPLPAALLDPSGAIDAASEAFWGALDLEPGGADHLDSLSEASLELEPGGERAIELRAGAVRRRAVIRPLAEAGLGYLLLLEDGDLSLQPLIQALPVGLFLVSPEHEIVAFNSALSRLVESEPGRFLHASYEQFFEHLSEQANEPEVVRGSLQQAVVAIREQPVVEIPVGERPRQHLEITFFPVFQAADGEPGWGGLVVDVTQARDQLAWKLELLSTLAHDLRTPLATLKGHATALLANHRRWSESMVAEFLEAMDRGTDELVRHVDRSLALTRVEAGRLGLRPEAIQPADLVQGALERAASALDEQTVELSLPEDLPAVRVDPARVEEVLVNLLENAARHSPPGKPIELYVEQNDTMVSFSVQDAGPGLAAEEQAGIFSRQSLDGAEGERAGLGLFISRKIVEAHGGRISVASPPPERKYGARFSFSVPVLPQQPRREQRERGGRTPAPAARSEASVLVVEAEPELQSLLRTILAEAAYQPTVVADGPRAIDQLAGPAPDLVVLDLALPRMDGLTVCRAMRRWSDVPILVLTEQLSAEDLVAAVDAGADDYLTKPFQSTELLARLRALLRRRERWGRSESRPAPLRAQGLTIDEARHEVRLDEELVALTPTEFQLLVYLARHRGQVLTHQQLIEHLWPQGQGNRHALFVHINRLRDKIEPDPEQLRYIVTRWGVGYTFLPRRRA